MPVIFIKYSGKSLAFRAADLLILSAQVGRKDNRLPDTLDVWEIEANALQGESLDLGDYPIQVFRRDEPQGISERASESIPESRGMNAIPPRG